MANEKIKGFEKILKVVLQEKKELFPKLSMYVFSVKSDDITKYEYKVGDKTWWVWDCKRWKIVGNSAEDYNYFFSKVDGWTLRFGKYYTDNPAWCELGPEILDLEIITGSCTPIKGCNCKFCYKRNTAAKGKEMTFETFAEVIKKFPKNLSQIALGITSLHGNKDLPKIVKSCIEDYGVIPNITTSCADLDDEMADLIVTYMGKCSCSCYEADPSVCYNGIKKLYDAAAKKGRVFNPNMHILLSRQTVPFVMKTLNDIRDGKVEGLGSVVFLRLKPVGNAEGLDATLDDADYDKIISFCLDNKIGFGFDSCGAKRVAAACTRLGHPEYAEYCEPCESSSFSAYINVDAEYASCSFVEKNSAVIEPIKVLNYESMTDVWHLPAVAFVREKTHACTKSCPWYNLD